MKRAVLRISYPRKKVNTTNLCSTESTKKGNTFTIGTTDAAPVENTAITSSLSTRRIASTTTEDPWGGFGKRRKRSLKDIFGMFGERNDSKAKGSSKYVCTYK